MKSKIKEEIVFLITLGIIFMLSAVDNDILRFKTRSCVIHSEYSNEIILDNEAMKLSKVSGRIYIDNNWSAAKVAGICTGSGSYSDPYIIEDLVIDDEKIMNCIDIRNSNVFFRIKNCTLFNAREGIRLWYVNNSKISNNDCSSTYNSAITLYHCFNNSISGNAIYNYNFGIILHTSNNNVINGNNIQDLYYGIEIIGSNGNSVLRNTLDNVDLGINLIGANNTISANTINYSNEGISLGNSNNNNILGNNLNNCEFGISLYDTINTTISGNIMNHCGVYLRGNLEHLTSNKIETTNLVNSKPLYYYINEVNLGSDNFTNGGQVILVNCISSVVSNLNTSHTTIGISLYYCNSNNITKNSINYNFYGIYLEMSNNITILGNNVKMNGIGIYLKNSNYNKLVQNDLRGCRFCFREEDCEGNVFENNKCNPTIPGYNILFLFGIISFLVIIIRRIKRV